VKDVDWMYLVPDMDHWQAGSCEHDNSPSGSIRGREFID